MILRGKLSAFTLASALLTASALAGCHHEHLSPNYGKSYNAWVAGQRVNQAPEHPEQARRVIEGLDAQEAHLVSKNYRRSAAGKSEEGNESGGGGRLLLVSPNRSGGEATSYMPPPSVPGGQ